MGQQVELRERRGGTEGDADGPGSPAEHGGRPIVEILQSGHRLAAGYTATGGLEETIEALEAALRG